MERHMEILQFPPYFNSLSKADFVQLRISKLRISISWIQTLALLYRKATLYPFDHPHPSAHVIGIPNLYCTALQVFF